MIGNSSIRPPLSIHGSFIAVRRARHVSNKSGSSAKWVGYGSKGILQGDHSSLLQAFVAQKICTVPFNLA